MMTTKPLAALAAIVTLALPSAAYAGQAQIETTVNGQPNVSISKSGSSFGVSESKTVNGVGAIVSWILTYNRVTQSLADLLISITSDPSIFMLLVLLALLVLGMLMDAVPIMVALAPLLAPIAKQYGVPDLQFGLVFVVTCLIGLVTPPVGVILFMTSSIANVPLEKISVAVLPFVLWMIAVALLMVFMAPVTLWLPGVLGF